MVLSADFCLSFSAVATILYLGWGRVASGRHWWHRVKLQWGISLAMIPLTLAIFQQGSLISPIVNLIAIPWVSWLIVPLALTGCIIVWLSPLTAHFIWWLALKNLQFLWQVLTISANLPLNSWHQALTGWQLLFALLAVILLLAPRGVPARYLAVLLLLPLLFPLYPLIADKQAKIIMLDNHYGQIVIVQTRHHLLLFTTPSAIKRIERSDIDKFFYALGINHLDRIIINDPYHRHSGCLSKIAVSQLPRLEAFSWNNCRNAWWDWDGVMFSVKTSKDRTKQLLLCLSAGGNQVLITSLLSHSFQNKLLLQQPFLQTSALLVANGYSQQIWQADFIAAVDPQWVISSAKSRGNSRKLWSTMVITPQQLGAIMLELGKTGITLQHYHGSGNPLAAPKY